MSGANAQPTASPPNISEPTSKAEDPIVQYIILRRDLWADQGWPLGPLIAQACHASLAALWLNRDDAMAQAYVAPDSLDRMHKVRMFVNCCKTLDLPVIEWFLPLL
jgi:Peptidyl-tRNA hydrolase PTH2